MERWGHLLTCLRIANAQDGKHWNSRGWQDQTRCLFRKINCLINILKSPINQNYEWIQVVRGGGWVKWVRSGQKFRKLRFSLCRSLVTPPDECVVGGGVFFGERARGSLLGTSKKSGDVHWLATRATPTIHTLPSPHLSEYFKIACQSTFFFESRQG